MHYGSLLSQGPTGDFGFKGVPGPKGPAGILVSIAHYITLHYSLNSDLDAYFQLEFKISHQ